MRKVVAMPLIPGQIGRGRFVRSDLGYATFGRATWRWWCARHGIDFIVLDRPLGGVDQAQMPPTFQRWLAPAPLIRERGPDTLVAVVDADTMIRWDAPDFFALARGFSAVAAADASWIARSIRAFQPLFPDVSLPWWEYVNVGLMVVGSAQLPALDAFLSFSGQNWAALSAVMQASNVGTDQTPLNFFLRRAGESIRILPRPYNFLHCFPMGPALRALANTPGSDPEQFGRAAFSRPWAFEFIDLAYVWHFNDVVTFRSLVMGEVWRRVAGHYPGAVVEDL